jgi:hypothetical protein
MQRNKTRAKKAATLFLENVLKSEPSSAPRLPDVRDDSGHEDFKKTVTRIYSLLDNLLQDKEGRMVKMQLLIWDSETFPATLLYSGKPETRESADVYVRKHIPIPIPIPKFKLRF